MARAQETRKGRKSQWGGILTTLGVLALIADLAFLVVPFTRIAEKAGSGLVGVIPTLGMSILHAARAIAFHQVDYFSLIARILVLFVAMVAVIVGLVLWRTRSGHEMASNQVPLSSLGEQEIE